MSQEELQRLLDAGLSLAAIGRRIGLTASGVGKMAKRYGIVPPDRQRYSAKPIDVGELKRMIELEATLPELASRFGVSITTLKKHLATQGLQTMRAAGLREHRLGRREGVRERSEYVHCKEHGETTFQIDTRGTYRCARVQVRSGRSSAGSG